MDQPLAFDTDVDLRETWVLEGEPAQVDSTSPRYGEQASYYSAVCLETGDAVRACLATPDPKPVPRTPARLQRGLQPGRGHLGLDPRGGDRQYLLRHQSRGPTPRRPVLPQHRQPD